MQNRFIVFDVETPNASNDRMSAIGITVVENCQITKEFYTLVNPEVHFDSFNIFLTGIQPDMVTGKPTFPVLWQLIEPMMRSGILVAHNAPFDVCVLAKCLRDYQISWSSPVRYACTYQMGRRCLPYMPNHKLNTLCQKLNIPLDHHNAGSDSHACARLLLYYQKTGFDVKPYIRYYDLHNLCTLRRTNLSVDYCNI